MASSTLNPYKDNTNHVLFSLASTSATGSKYLVSGRSISAPYLMEITRKVTAPSASANDHVIVRVARTELNATTSKLATAQVSIDISIPKDASVLDATAQKEIISVLVSTLNEAAAMEATNVNITSLIEGRDL